MTQEMGPIPLMHQTYMGKALGGGVHITFATTLQDVNEQLQRSRQFDALLVHKDWLAHTDHRGYDAVTQNRVLNPDYKRPYAWLIDQVDVRCRIVMSGEYPEGSKTVIGDGADVYLDGNSRLDLIGYPLSMPELQDPRNLLNRTRGVLSIGANNTTFDLFHPDKEIDPTWMKYVVTNRDGFTPLIEGVPIQNLDLPTRFEHRGGRREGD